MSGTLLKEIWSGCEWGVQGAGGGPCWALVLGIWLPESFLSAQAGKFPSQSFRFVVPVGNTLICVTQPDPVGHCQGRQAGSG